MNLFIYEKNYLLDWHAIEMANDMFFFDGRFRRTVDGGIELANRREYLKGTKTKPLVFANFVSSFFQESQNNLANFYWNEDIILGNVLITWSRSMLTGLMPASACRANSSSRSHANLSSARRHQRKAMVRKYTAERVVMTALLQMICCMDPAEC